MSDITTFMQVVKDLGIPALFFIVVAYLLFKSYPEYQKQKALEREAQLKQEEQDRKAAAEERRALQEYYNQRNKSYEEQMSIITKVAEQGNQMIGQATQIISQSTEVIRMNTEAIRASSEVHKEVREALGRDLYALQALVADLKVHDRRAEQICLGVEKLLDRTE